MNNSIYSCYPCMFNQITQTYGCVFQNVRFTFLKRIRLAVWRHTFPAPHCHVWAIKMTRFGLQRHVFLTHYRLIRIIKKTELMWWSEFTDKINMRITLYCVWEKHAVSSPKRCQFHRPNMTIASLRLTTGEDDDGVPEVISPLYANEFGV